MTTAVRRIQFCAGHRLLGHESKCANIHGHNYVAFFHATVNSGHLDTVGRVIDFSVLKQKIGGWIDENWDHTFVANELDDHAIGLIKADSNRNKEPFLLPYNPTAENMALYLLTVVCPRVLQGEGVTVERVVLWETENCFAEVSIYD